MIRITKLGLLACALGCALGLGSNLRAQPQNVASQNKKNIMDEGEAKAASGGMPTFTGKGKITEAINSDTGALFEFGGGVTMLFPKGLPVGRSRLVTLQKARGRVPGQLADKKWKALGPALDFSGAFNTARNPIVLSVPSKRDPVTSGKKLVVAMEVGGFCEGANKSLKLKGGLCSNIELHDAEYDAAGKRLVANLRSTGGLRLQFGLVSASEE